MQLFIGAGGKPWADELAIRGGVRLDANDADGVSFTTLADVEQSYVSEAGRGG
ncbi:MAG: hypothetical protein WCA38_03080 [Candidatus Acidiferrales bacterium]